MMQLEGLKANQREQGINEAMQRAKTEVAEVRISGAEGTCIGNSFFESSINGLYELVTDERPGPVYQKRDCKIYLCCATNGMWFVHGEKVLTKSEEMPYDTLPTEAKQWMVPVEKERVEKERVVWQQKPLRVC